MYLVIELQKNGDTLAHLATVKETREEAEQLYHNILSAAAVSTVSVHSAALMNEEGVVIKRETYKHEEVTA